LPSGFFRVLALGRRSRNQIQIGASSRKGRQGRKVLPERPRSRTRESLERSLPRPHGLGYATTRRVNDNAPYLCDRCALCVRRNDFDPNLVGTHEDSGLL
jgi:hypothetical protein